MYSENLQQIYRRTPICRSAISIKLQSNFIEIALRHGCSPVNLLHIFRTSFPKNTCGRLLLPVDKGKTFSALFTNLSYVFDCLPHDLIIAKLNAYRFSFSATKLIQSYLSNRKQRTTINNEYNSWEEIIFVVPQGSILGPFSFNIFICDLFSVMNNIKFASYADYNTPYSIGMATEFLKEASDELFCLFTNNQMRAKSWQVSFDNK